MLLIPSPASSYALITLPKKSDRPLRWATIQRPPPAVQALDIVEHSIEVPQPYEAQNEEVMIKN